MNKTDQSEQEIRSLQDAADELEKYVKLRALPRPPYFLANNRLEAWEMHAPDRSQPSRGVFDAVAPHWNASVDLLNGGPSGYLALIGIRDSLRSRADATRERVEKTYSESFVLNLVQSTIEAERDRYGDKCEVREIAGDLLRRAAVEGWRWVSQSDNAYLLEVDPDSYSPFEPGEMERLGPIRTAFPHETWQDVSDRVAYNIQDFKDRSTPTNREHDLYRFRLDVVEQVLIEYEALGSVSQLYQESIHERRLAPVNLKEYTIDRLLFIVLCKDQVESASQKASRREILGGKGNEIGGVDARAMEAIAENDELKDVKWNGESKGGGGKARYLAEREPISMWRSADAEDNDRPYFDGRVRELYNQISSAGILTVQDVIAEAVKRRGARR